MTNIVLDPTKNDEKNDMIALTLRIRYSKSFVNLHTRKKIWPNFTFIVFRSNTLVGKHHIIDVLKGQYQFAYLIYIFEFIYPYIFN